MADTDESERPVSAETLAAWKAPEPKSDFATRVVAKMGEQDQSEREHYRDAPIARPVSRGRTARRIGSIALFGVALAAAVALVITRVRPHSAVSGARIAIARESIQLGRRGIAVAEKGAQLSWSITNSGAAAIDQSLGSVFYRVEPGGPFVVRTPAGEVTVHGTCFTVEVTEMKANRAAIVGVGVGAALATITVVTVYEGRVSAANSRGKTELSAGEGATMTNDAPPTPTTQKLGDESIGEVAGAINQPRPSLPANATPEQLAAKALEQGREIVALEQKIRELEIARDMAQAANRAGGPSSSPFFEPSKAELAAMAAECKLQWDSPPLNLEPELVSPKQATRWGLHPDQLAAVNQVVTEFNAEQIGKLREIYVEVTGDKTGADTLTPRALMEDTEQKVPRADLREAFRRLSAERAGLIQPPADLSKSSPIERLMRQQVEAGNAYEAALAKVIGPARARAARAANDGWGSKNGSSYGCPE